jgi:hypothetical protein
MQIKAPIWTASEMGVFYMESIKNNITTRSYNVNVVKNINNNVYDDNVASRN